jgi:hypothetical protein
LYFILSDLDPLFYLILTLSPLNLVAQAFVGYRDFGGQAGDWTGPGGHFRVHDFVDKSRAGELRDYLAQIKDGGGGDAEDVTGALAVRCCRAFSRHKDSSLFFCFFF